jgi:hypothetical protein
MGDVYHEDINTYISIIYYTVAYMLKAEPEKWPLLANGSEITTAKQTAKRRSLLGGRFLISSNDSGTERIRIRVPAATDGNATEERSFYVVRAGML